jgi:membrane-bound inhibitor of C-type lysozyme
VRGVALACALWAGGAAGQEVAASAATYVCAGGAVLRVAYINIEPEPALAVIDWAGSLVALRTTPTGSGAHYVALDAGRGLHWRTKGGEGVLFETASDGAERPLLAACVTAAR